MKSCTNLWALNYISHYPLHNENENLNIECDDGDQIGHVQIHTALHTPISVGGEFSVEKVSVGHINFLVEVELLWVQDPTSSPKSSWRLPINKLNISYKTIVKFKIIVVNRIDILENTTDVAHANFLY